MNLLVPYFSERRRRLSQFSLGRWWLSEYLGRGLVGVGVGGLLLRWIPESIHMDVALGILLAGLLVTVLCYERKQPPIEVRVGRNSRTQQNNAPED